MGKNIHYFTVNSLLEPNKLSKITVLPRYCLDFYSDKIKNIAVKCN